MEINTEKYKQLVLEIINKLKELDAERMALRGLVPTLIPHVDLQQRLEAAKNFDPLQQLTHEKWEPPMETFREQTDESVLRRAILEFIRDPNSSRLVN
jgi:hypothetical protein